MWSVHSSLFQGASGRPRAWAPAASPTKKVRPGASLEKLVERHHGERVARHVAGVVRELFRRGARDRQRVRRDDDALEIAERLRSGGLQEWRGCGGEK